MKGPVLIEVDEDDLHAKVRWVGTAEEWTALETPLELLRLPHSAFRAMVADLDGRPLEGVSVTGTRKGGNTCPAVLSHKDGTVTIPSLGAGGSPMAEKTGWVMCSEEKRSDLEKRSAGPCSITMARSGKLLVSVGDSREAPDFAVAIVSGSESMRRSSFVDHMTFDRPADEDHVVRIDGLPVGQRLVVLTGLGQVYSHMLGERLVLEPESDLGGLPVGAVPIVIPEGGVLGVRMDRSRFQSVKGEVVDEAGRPLPGALVVLGAHWRALRRGRSEVAKAKTDELGKFELRWPTTGELKPYLLVAEASDTYQLDTLTPKDIQSGEPLKIVLEGPQVVKGTVRVADGSPGDARVFITLLSPELPNPRCEDLPLERTVASVNSDGTFRFTGLRNGRYEVFAKHPDFASEKLLVGSTSPAPLEISLTRPKATTVKLTLDFGPSERKALLDLAVVSWEELNVPGGTKSSDHPTRHKVNWADGLGEIRLGAGVHTIEVRAVMKGGVRLVTLPLGDLQVGDEPIERPVVLAPELDGLQRVKLPPGGSRGGTWATLHEPGSRRALEFGTAASGRRTRFIQIDARCAFRFTGPAGTYDLRIGSRAELMRGKGRLVPGVQICAGP